MGNLQLLTGLLLLSAAQALADLVWENPSRELEPSPAEQTREIVFRALNPGPETAHIESVESSCSCLSVRLSARTVPPGGQTQLTAILHSSQTPSERWVRVVLSTAEAPARPQALRIHLLPPQPRIEPALLWWIQGDPCTPKSLRIFPHGRIPSLPPPSPESNFRATLTAEESSSSFQLTVQPRSTSQPVDTLLQLTWTPPLPQTLGGQSIPLRIFPAHLAPSSNATAPKSVPYIEVLRGSLPIVLSAPHGGREKPDHIPDRPRGIFAFDTNTSELGRASAQALQRATGQAADLVLCLLHRSKVDCNREPDEGTAGNPDSLAVWNAYHSALESALRRAVQTHGIALLIDLHGHGHKIPRSEIGYGHDSEIYSLPEARLNTRENWSKSTLSFLMERPTHPFPYSELLHGPKSLGTLLSLQGFNATPSHSVPVPPTPYFNGGYTVRHFPQKIPGVVAVQIETHYVGLRDSAENRKRFGESLAEALREYLPAFLGISLPNSSP